MPGNELVDVKSKHTEYVEETIDLRRYLVLFRRWAWLLLLVSILAGVITFAANKLMTPMYQASTTLLINEARPTNTTDYNAILTSERLARTYADLLTSRPVLFEVIERLELGFGHKQLLDMVDVQIIRDTQLIKVFVEDVSPARASLIANTIVEVFIEQNFDLQISRFVLKAVPT